MQDTDLFADMGPTAVEDAWQWLPLQARLTLVHFLGHLPQLAGQLSNSNPESRAKLDDALQQLLEGAELTSAQRNALKMATELVVCGEEVSYPHDVSQFTDGVCAAVHLIMRKTHAASYTPLLRSAPGIWTVLAQRPGCCAS